MGDTNGNHNNNAPKDNPAQGVSSPVLPVHHQRHREADFIRRKK